MAKLNEANQADDVSKNSSEEMPFFAQTRGSASESVVQKWKRKFSTGLQSDLANEQNGSDAPSPA